MEHLRCVVERITYQNEDNGYTCRFCSVFGWLLEDGCKIWPPVFSGTF